MDEVMSQTLFLPRLDILLLLYGQGEEARKHHATMNSQMLALGDDALSLSASFSCALSLFSCPLPWRRANALIVT